MAKKLYIMKGLPASGKSTRAQEIIERDVRAVRINKDLLRTMLHFDKWNGKNEKLTHDSSLSLALHHLVQGVNVIIDDTNLNPNTLKGYYDIAKTAKAQIEIVDMTDVDIAECITRDAKREKKVGKDVIINMALRTGLYDIPGPIIICDLDGTLCDIDHRLKFVKGEKKDWGKFFSLIHHDSIRFDVFGMIKKAHEEGKSIVFVSGRPEDYKQATLDWLNEYGINFFTTLIMRRKGDSRPDDIVKEEILGTYFRNKDDIELVIDDRPRVIRMWQRNGLKVKDVGNGVEF